MRSTRLTLAVTALLAVAALSGCSGDDDEPGASPESGSAAPGSESTDRPFQRDCEVTVEVTGVVEASWTGKGLSSDQTGITTYTFADGDDTLTVYAGNDDIPVNANVTIDGATYTTQTPDGLDVAEGGANASVDAETVGVDGDGPHLAATFTCAKGKGEA